MPRCASNVVHGLAHGIEGHGKVNILRVGVVLLQPPNFAFHYPSSLSAFPNVPTSMSREEALPENKLEQVTGQLRPLILPVSYLLVLAVCIMGDPDNSGWEPLERHKPDMFVMVGRDQATGRPSYTLFITKLERQRGDRSFG